MDILEYMFGYVGDGVLRDYKIMIVPRFALSKTRPGESH